MYIRDGLSAKEIQEAWRDPAEGEEKISIHTINTLTARLMKKIGINRRAKIAVWADRLKRQEMEAQLAADVSEGPHKGRARDLARAEKI